MDKIIRYTNAGHRFEIDGILEPGYTITITVIEAGNRGQIYNKY
jgi:hypothetical protein